MQRLIRTLAVALALALILAGCITGDDDDSDDDSSPGGALSTVISGIGDDEEDETKESEDESEEETEEAEEDAEEETEEAEEEETSGVVWSGEADGDEEYEICFIVADDGSKLTAVNDGCDDFSLVADVEVEADSGSDCEFTIETSEDIPIVNGRFELITNDTTITGEIGSNNSASGAIDGECSISWEASPEN